MKTDKENKNIYDSEILPSKYSQSRIKLYHSQMKLL